MDRKEDATAMVGKQAYQKPEMEALTIQAEPVLGAASPDEGFTGTINNGENGDGMDLENGE